MTSAQMATAAVVALAAVAALALLAWSSARARHAAAQTEVARLRQALSDVLPHEGLRHAAGEGIAWVDSSLALTPLTAAFDGYLATPPPAPAKAAWSDLFQPGHAERATRLLENVRNGRSAFETLEFAAAHPLPDGERWCRMTIRPGTGDNARRGVFVTLQDFSELRALRLLRDEMRASMAGVDDAVVSLHGDTGAVAWVNPAFETFSGYPSEHARGRGLEDLLDAQPTGEAMPSTLELVAVGGNWQGEFRNTSPHGEQRLVRRHVYLVEDEAGQGARHIVVFKDLSRELATQEHLQVLSQVDVAIELPNLYGFLALLQTRLREAAEGARLSVVHLDFHACEALRETQGTLAVDAGLRRIAACLARCLRDDNGLSRVGPAQLALVLPTASLPAIESVLRAMTAVLASQGSVEDTDLYTAVSIGVAPGGEGVSPENLLRAAQLTSARLDPRSGVSLGYFTQQLQAETSRRLRVEHALREVLRDNPHELTLHFQPKVDPYAQALVGFEALCRWKSPRLGQVFPGEFIPAAERTGLIVALGEHAFAYACRTLAAWREAGLVPHPVAVNVSAHQLARPTLADELVALAGRFDVPCQLLELEVTESAVMEDIESAVRLLEKLRGAGFSVALDDFGTGQSSLSYLRSLPLDTLKIDRSFICDIETRADAVAVCKSILDLGKTLKLKVVAEGVETAGQLEFLMRQRCDVIQGYVFSPAVPADEAAEMLDAKSARSSTMMGHLTH